jgi:hypothetical protein
LRALGVRGTDPSEDLDGIVRVIEVERDEDL